MTFKSRRYAIAHNVDGSTNFHFLIELIKFISLSIAQRDQMAAELGEFPSLIFVGDD